jgi:hypothetical protein
LGSLIVIPTVAAIMATIGYLVFWLVNKAR